MHCPPWIVSLRLVNIRLGGSLSALALLVAASAAACGGVGWRATPTHPGGVNAEIYLEANPPQQSPASAPDEGEHSGGGR